MENNSLKTMIKAEEENTLRNICTAGLDQDSKSKSLTENTSVGTQYKPEVNSRGVQCDTYYFKVQCDREEEASITSQTTIPIGDFSRSMSCSSIEVVRGCNSPKSFHSCSDLEILGVERSDSITSEDLKNTTKKIVCYSDSEDTSPENHEGTSCEQHKRKHKVKSSTTSGCLRGEREEKKSVRSEEEPKSYYLSNCKKKRLPTSPTSQSNSSQKVQGRRPYTKEDHRILQYIIERKVYKFVKGKGLWVEMEEQKICDRSWQSMKEHFRRQILPHINSYHLDSAINENFQKMQ